MRTRVYITALVAAGFVAGCGGSGAGTVKPRKAATVDIHSFKFSPSVIALEKGARVTWTNSDAAAHTATADNRSFDTLTINHGKSRVVVFRTAGTFPYHCDFHPFMKATIVVK